METPYSDDCRLELEPFGSFVTELGLSGSEEGGRSDLDVVVLFHGSKADTWGSKEPEQRRSRFDGKGSSPLEP